ncbi:RNA-binding S4 domain-containing protein [Chloracidobacterium sp. MS 40/45]|uniref:RNA-binding S4 domain-containing protein n=1 Tax=Chloracidobacterium aggregatum TaxID=2851959 RepID=UPI001B8D7385|nr:RNA-binding S4 domain-containing protein [Chloracidobacterium aggregatum]QUW00585.1 RNA-binding S4 domain-containing protein [Chloracidobacterium sp. MS 40/45]
MRLDSFLKASRLVPRRTVAQHMCEAGAVLVNGLPAKSSRLVRPGDTLTLHLRHRRLVARVLAVPETKTVKAPTTLYERLSEEILAEDPLTPVEDVP